MAMLDRAVTTAGPPVNNVPTVLTLLSPEQLRVYPHLPQVKNLINTSFAATHMTGDLFPRDVMRLETDLQILTELEPDFFTYILSSAETDPNVTPKLYASASGHRYISQTALENLPAAARKLKRAYLEGEEGVMRWELKLLVVDPTLHRSGLGSLMMGHVEKEIKQRFRDEQLVASKDANHKPEKLLFLLDTIKDVNYNYYAKRGWTVTEEKEYEAGTFGASRNFTSVWMQKPLLLDE